jgi:hypothetical protein
MAGSGAVVHDPVVAAAGAGAAGDDLVDPGGGERPPVVHAEPQLSPPRLPVPGAGSCPGTATRIDGGMLTVRCTSGAFYYTAQRPGTAELKATVRPRCARGSMCPQWITEATLTISIL